MTQNEDIPCSDNLTPEQQQKLNAGYIVNSILTTLLGELRSLEGRPEEYLLFLSEFDETERSMVESSAKKNPYVLEEWERYKTENNVIDLTKKITQRSISPEMKVYLQSKVDKRKSFLKLREVIADQLDETTLTRFDAIIEEEIAS